MRFTLRSVAVLFVVFLCYAFLKDTVDWYFFMDEPTKDLIRLSAEEMEVLPDEVKTQISELKIKRRNVINLGLDLQGGLYLVLSVNEDQLKDNLDQRYRVQISEEKAGEELSEQELITLVAARLNENLAMEREAAIRSAYRVIGNRINEFGISEPIVNMGSDERIYISLAGVQDPQAAEEIVSRAGRLTFQIYDLDTQSRFTRKYGEANPELFIRVSRGRSGEWLIAPGVDLPADFDLPADSRLYYLWESDAFGLPQVRGGIFLKRDVLFDGQNIAYAYPSFGEMGTDVNVSFRVKSEAIELFGDATGENIGNFLAIVLDDKVQSYPRINSRIGGGQGQITGSFTHDEARNLAAILNAGSFDVSLRVEEKRAVGPSLGRDSVRAGMNAILIGFGLVFIFMLVYYKFAGFVANIALLFNLVIVLAVMTQLGATLTLPGIAGLILTLGMSVDANVIIFERIKEELRTGKSQLVVAVEKGFKRAFSAIFDANLTTLLAALVMMQLGTGSIQGFAVTLFIGILSSMFTALFVSRLLIDFTVNKFHLKRLAI